MVTHTTSDSIAPAEGPSWVALDGGTFLAGSNDFYPDEAPVREQSVAAFALARTPITNRQFAAFVEATSYVTVAERPLPADEFPQLSDAERAPGSLVFTPTSGPVDLSDWQQWWRWVSGAQWRQPRGMPTDLAAIADHPVVQIAYADALAYAEWVGGRLPTEAELEYAACGGSTPAPYAWGDSRDRDGQLMANTWRGNFPYRNEGAHGWVGTSPVGTFPANGYGLFDNIGNVWEWTSDVYGDPAPTSGCGCGGNQVRNAGGEEATPGIIPQRVLKGGSHLCAPEYCLRYRPAARTPQAEDSATTHIGFRVARDLQ